MGNSVIQVPQGQIVRIWQDNAFSFQGIIDGNVRFSVSSTFGSMLGRGAESQGALGKISDFAVNKISELFGGANDQSVGFSTVFPQMTARVWESTDPLKINFDLTYIQGLWGMTGPGIVSEVKRIMALSLPSLGGAAGTLIPPGPTISTIYASPDDDKETTISKVFALFGGGVQASVLDAMLSQKRKLEEMFKSGEAAGQSTVIQGTEPDIANGVRGFRYRRGRAINAKIGNYFELKNILVEASDPEFSDICDASGFPVWAKVSVTISSLITATTNMLGIDNAGNAIKPTGGA